MHPDIEFMPAAVEFAGGDDFGGIVEIVTLFAEVFAVETQLERTVVMGLGADELHFVSSLRRDRERQRERVADLTARPPEVIIATPAASLEGAHLLAGSLAASDGEYLQALAFDGALETPDAGCGRREAVWILQISDKVNDLFLGLRA
jgi:hypothetical protein